jgi:iron complex outermembrane receptor protein
VRALVSILLGAASCCAITSAAEAQTAPAAAPAASSSEGGQLAEIVVTARRRSESLQEVPQTVNAITSDTLLKLNIQQFENITAVTPGLSLEKTFGNPSIGLRGVEWQQQSTAPIPVIAMYLNDAPVQSNNILQAMFDVGQIEVLKGPQGTTRGVSAPAGAITLTTHKPDLSEFGGYASATLTDLQGHNLQAAVNVPLIKDVLAVRVAGLFDENRANSVRSIYNNLPPRQMTTGARVSVSFEPNDAFNANIVYQHLDAHVRTFQQVSGGGAGAPVITPEMRASVAVNPDVNNIPYDVVTAQIDSRIFGQHLSYVGSYQHQKVDQVTGSNNGHSAPGDILEPLIVPQEGTSHEIRLASDPAPGRVVDYTVGGYYSWLRNKAFAGIVSGLPGALGSPALGNVGPYNPRFSLPIDVFLPNQSSQEISLFGSVTFHLGENTELSGGIRHIWSITNAPQDILIGGGFAAVPAALFGGNCAVLRLSSTYPGFCDFPVPSPGSIHTRFYSSQTPNIYNVSLSHHFSRDLLVYANTGTSFRPAVAGLSVQGPLAGCATPVGAQLNCHDPERSRSYEVGVKATFLDNRARVNAAVFRQRYSNYLDLIPNIQYFNGSRVTTANVTASVDTLVQGFDIDSEFQITRDWNLALLVSYSDGKVQGQQVPCNINGPNGQPIFNTSVPGANGPVPVISLCPGAASSRQPLWNASLQTEYTHPVTDDVDGFIRGLVTYYPENKRIEPTFTADKYALVNLYLGARSRDGAWEASLFARNILNNNNTLDVNSASEPAILAGQPPTNYFATVVTNPREVGVSVRCAFGSR